MKIAATLLLLASIVPQDGFAQGAQAASAADGPWSGQAQCVLSTRGTNYQDDQTHTWRITSGPPLVTGAARHWPAVWSVQGSGSRTIGAASDSWTTNVPETSAPIAVWEVPGLRGANRLRIGSQHAQKTAGGAVRVKASSGENFAATVWEWQFPVIEDAATATSISGTNTQSLPVGPGWQRPFGVQTTATCTWSFTRAGASTTTALPQVSSIGTPVNSGVVLANPSTSTGLQTAVAVATPTTVAAPQAPTATVSIPSTRSTQSPSPSSSPTTPPRLIPSTTGRPLSESLGSADRWSGWVRCQLGTSQGTYTAGIYGDQHTQTWTITGAPSVQGDVAIYPATWSVSGSGNSSRGIGAGAGSFPGGDWEHSWWDINSAGTVASIEVRAAGGRVAFSTSRTPLQVPVAMSGFIGNQTGEQRSGAAYSVTGNIVEFFPPIEAADGPRATGSSAPLVPRLVAPIQPAGTQTVASCTWSLEKGVTLSALAPPPPPAPTTPNPVFRALPQPAAPAPSPPFGPVTPSPDSTARRVGELVGGKENVLSTAPPSGPRPPIPINVRATIHGNIVRVEWDLGGLPYSGFFTFTVTRNGVAAPQRWQRETFDDTVPVPGEYTYGIRGHGHTNYSTTTPPESSSQEVLLTVRVPPWPGWKQGYRVIANAVRAHQTTSEDLLIADGRGDEIYVATHVDLVEIQPNPCAGRVGCSGATPPPQVTNQWRIESPVYGDTSNRPSSERPRILAGSLNPGGIAAGDLIPARQTPYDPSGAFDTPTSGALPQILWQGDLEYGKRQFLLVTPGIWEYDGNRSRIDAWMGKRQDIVDVTSQRRAADSLEPYTHYLSSTLQGGVDVPIGHDANSTYWGRTIVVTPEAIDKLLTGGSQSGLAPGALALNFVDQSALRGNYTLYLRFEPLPSAPVSSGPFTPTCGFGLTLQASGRCE